MNGWSRDTNSENNLIRESCIEFTDLDLIGIGETHLKGRDTLNVSGYRWFGRNRSNVHVKSKKGSGGVGVLIKSEVLNTFDISVLDDTQEDVLWINLEHKYTKENNRICIPTVTCMW